MRLSRGTLAPVAVVALSLISVEGLAAKCFPQLLMPGLGPSEAVVQVDGSVVLWGTEELDGMDASVIHSVDITCWNPTTGEFGVGGGIPVIVVMTKHFVESTRAPIEALLRAQEAYFSQHSRYAQSLDDLVEFRVPEDAMLEFSATSAGWSAATPPDDVAYRCFVFSGNAAQELAEMKEHGVVCQLGASRALREMYEVVAPSATAEALVPPSPLGLIIPPPGASLRGTVVQLRVFVDERGRLRLYLPRAADAGPKLQPTSDPPG